MTTPSPLRIYLASSWRNPHHQDTLEALRAAGHEVYDFKAPQPGDDGFSWREIDPDWKDWTPEQYLEALQHPAALAGYEADHAAMDWADLCVQVQPCGVSAALEVGEFIGSGRPTVIYLAGIREPELMFKGATRLCLALDEVLEAVAELSALIGWHCYRLLSGRVLIGRPVQPARAADRMRPAQPMNADLQHVSRLVPAMGFALTVGEEIDMLPMGEPSGDGPGGLPGVTITTDSGVRVSLGSHAIEYSIRLTAEQTHAVLDRPLGYRDLAVKAILEGRWSPKATS